MRMRGSPEDDMDTADDKKNVAPPALRPEQGDRRWTGVAVMQYKQEGSAPFRDITRQVLFDDPQLAAQMRYFEMAPGGYSTLERHQHMHAVMILRGSGHCLVGDLVFEVNEHDLVTIPALAWHQFRAPDDAPMGFLCVVNAVRDKPQLPTPADLDALRADAAIAAFIRT
jgi:quercetin dioxygenase-like cupin family protein